MGPLKLYIRIGDERLELRSQDQGVFSMFKVQKTCKVIYVNRAFCKAASSLWNNLPNVIYNSSSVNIPKWKLKT